MSKKEVEKEYGERLYNDFKLVDVILEKMVSNNYISSNNVDANKYRISLRMPLPLDDYDNTVELCDDNTLYYEVACNEASRMFEKLFTRIDSKEKYILKQHYGFDSLEPRTFIDIGNEFGISSKAVHQKTKRVIEKIQRSSLLKDFKDIYQELAEQNYNPNKIVRERQYIKKR